MSLQGVNLALKTTENIEKIIKMTFQEKKMFNPKNIR